MEDIISKLAETQEEKNNKIVNIDSFQEDGNIVIQADNEYFAKNLYTTNMFDGNEYSKFLKNVVSMVRKTTNYRSYVGEYLKGELGLVNCAILGDISDEEDADIEMHHYPFTLYDIADIVTISYIESNTPFTTFMITQEIIDLHYKNMVGLVPLSETVHELVHTGDIFLNLNQVFGDVKSFTDQYDKHIPEVLKLDYNKLVEYSDLNLDPDPNNILEVKIQNWNKFGNEVPSRSDF